MSKHTTLRERLEHDLREAGVLRDIGDMQLPDDAVLDEWAEPLIIEMWKRHHPMFKQPSDEKAFRATWTDFKQGAQAMLALVRESPADFGVVAEPTEEAGNVELG